MAKLSDWIRRKRPTVCSAVVVAAGSSRRMGEDKLKMRLGGMPVLARTLKALQQSDTVGEIVVVTRVDKLEETALLCRDYGITKAKKVVAGGESRTESALAGLMAVDKRSKLVMIHLALHDDPGVGHHRCAEVLPLLRAPRKQRRGVVDKVVVVVVPRPLLLHGASGAPCSGKERAYRFLPRLPGGVVVARHHALRRGAFSSLFHPTPPVITQLFVPTFLSPTTV